MNPRHAPSDSPRRPAVLAATVVCLFLAAASWLTWSPQWRAVLAVSPQRNLAGILDLTRSLDGQTTGSVRAIIEGDYRATSSGLILAPGAMLRIDTTAPMDQLDISISSSPPTAVWSVSLGDDTRHVIEGTTQRADGAKHRYPLQPEKPGLWVAISAPKPPSESPDVGDRGEGVVASRDRKTAEAPSRAGESISPRLWEARYSFADRRANRLPPAPLLIATILVVAQLLILSSTTEIRGRGGMEGRKEGRGDERRNWEFLWIVRAGIVLFGLLVALSSKSWNLSAGAEAAFVFLEAAALAFGACVGRAAPVIKENGKDLNPRSSRVVWILAAILLVAFQLRWGGYVDHRRQPLLPDAAGFLEIVESGSWYATAASRGPWVREPLWIWVNRVAGWALGMNENTLRLVSLVMGLLTIAQAARLGTRWFGPAVGLLAALGLALSPRWIDWTARGLRTDFYTLIVLTFVFEWDRFRDGPRKGWRAPVALGALAAAAHLTYISSLSWTLPLILCRLWRWPRRARWIALSLAVALLPLVPHLIFNYTFRNSHDLLYSSNIHARYYRNYERYGLPGSPEREKFLEAPYGGPPVTTLGYLLGEHSLGQLAAGAVRGAYNIYLYRVAGIEQFGASRVLTLLYVLGVALALFSRAGRRSIAVWIWLGLPFLYLASLPGFATRLLAPLTPWMWFYLALAGTKVVGLGRALLPWKGRPSSKEG